MQNAPPNRFAGYLAGACMIVMIMARAAGVEITETGYTNILIVWGVVSLGRAIEWHADHR